MAFWKKSEDPWDMRPKPVGTVSPADPDQDEEPENLVASLKAWNEARKEEKARKEIHQMDKSRASYYAYYTEQRWGQREHYDLCIDAGRMPVPAIVAAIKDLASAI